VRYRQRAENGSIDKIRISLHNENGRSFFKPGEESVTFVAFDELPKSGSTEAKGRIYRGEVHGCVR
jgi:hypothetical protein